VRRRCQAENAARSGQLSLRLANGVSLLSLRDEVRLVDRTGETVARFPNPSALRHDDQNGGCMFTSDGGHVWAIVPAVRGNRLVDELWLPDRCRWTGHSVLLVRAGRRA
jgi:hypothetical protein